jgi:hypothetical protein
MTEAEALRWCWRAFVATLCVLEGTTLVAGMSLVVGVAWIALLFAGVMFRVIEDTRSV